MDLPSVPRLQALLEDIWEDGSHLIPVAPKPGGAFVGAIYQLEGGRRWMGKVGFNEDEMYLEQSVVRRGTIRNAIKEKFAADCYLVLTSCLANSYSIPRYRLASLQILNKFTETHEVAKALVREINERRSAFEGSSIHVMSEMVEGYNDLKDARVKHGEGSMLMYDFIKETGTVPEKILLGDEEIPLLGLVELLAASRLLGDVDVLGNVGTNTGFVVTGRLGGVKIAQCVKIDPGLAFSFDIGLNKLITTYTLPDTGNLGFSPKRLQDLRDIQIGAGTALVVKWSALTPQQRSRFLSALHTGLEVFEDPTLLKYLIMRDGKWNRFEAVFNEEHFKKYQKDIATNFKLLRDVHSEGLKQVFSLRAQLDFVSKLLIIIEQFITAAREKVKTLLNSQSQSSLKIFKNANQLLAFLSSKHLDRSSISLSLLKDLSAMEKTIKDSCQIFKNPQDEGSDMGLDKLALLLRNLATFMGAHIDARKWLPRTVNGKLLRSQTVDLFVIGPTKAGKSTLINALLGILLCHMDSNPATAHYTKFMQTAEDSFVIEDKDGKELFRSKELQEAQNWLRENEKVSKGKEFVVKVPQTASETLGICTITDCPGFSEKRFFPMFLDKSGDLKADTLMVCVISLLESLKNAVQEDALNHLQHLTLFRVVFVLTNAHVYADRTKKALKGKKLTAEQILEETTNKIRTEFINPLQTAFPHAQIEIVDINEDRKVVWDKVTGKLVAEPTVQTEQQQVGGLVALVERERLRHQQDPLKALNAICQALRGGCLMLYDREPVAEEVARFSTGLDYLVAETLDSYRRKLDNLVKEDIPQALLTCTSEDFGKKSTNLQFDESALRYLTGTIEPLFYNLQFSAWRIFCDRVDSDSLEVRNPAQHTVSLPTFKKNVSWCLATKVAPVVLAVPAFVAITMGPGGVYWAKERRELISRFLLEHCQATKGPRITWFKRFLISVVKQLTDEKRGALLDPKLFEQWANQHKGPLLDFYYHQLVLENYPVMNDNL